MTNLERWKLWNNSISSPEIFKDWAFYSIISAALQRRVFLGSQLRMPLHTPLFVVLAGPPGCGKSNMVRQVRKVFSHELLQKNPGFISEEQKDELMTNINNTAVANKILLKDMERIRANSYIPMSPNKVTYEQLMIIMSKLSRHFHYYEKGEKKMQFHSSLFVLLDELGDLIDKEAAKTMTFLNQAYDCDDAYSNETKNQGCDYVRKPCVNVMAGATLDFLRRVYESRFMMEGFSSRAVFLVSETQGERNLISPEPTAEEQAEYLKLVKHVRELVAISGPVKFSQGCLEYLKQWWEVDDLKKRKLLHPKLDHYANRKNITAMKLTSCIHFADSLDLEIGIDSAITALGVLAEAEKNMVKALNFDTKNPRVEAAEKIHRHIHNFGPIQKNELKVIFWEFMENPEDDLNMILSYLEEAGKIEKVNDGRTYKGVVR